MPKDVESYYQEAGRAGRDGAYAHCALLFGEGDVRTARFLINNASENETLDPDDRERLRLRDLRRLERMVGYCKTSGCLRAYLLRYFGEDAPDRCGKCSSCAGDLERRDITVEAQKILSAVIRVERQYRSSLGAAMIIQLLRGSREQRVLQLGLDKLPTYGIMKDVDRARLRAYIDCLTEQGYLFADGTDYPVLRAAPRAKGVLFHGERVTFVGQKAQEPERRPPSQAAPLPDGADPELLERLRALRTRLAAAGSVPAYVVFSNAVLLELAARRPATLEEFLAVPGVGTVKAQRYGKAFLDAIAQWRDGQEE